MTRNHHFLEESGPGSPGITTFLKNRAQGSPGKPRNDHFEPRETSGKPRNDHFEPGRPPGSPGMTTLSPEDAPGITQELDDASGYIPDTSCCSWCTREWCTRGVYPALPGVPCPTTLSCCTPPCPTLLYTVGAVHTAGLGVYTVRVVLGAVLGLFPLYGPLFLVE